MLDSFMSFLVRSRTISSGTVYIAFVTHRKIEDIMAYILCIIKKKIKKKAHTKQMRNIEAR